MKKKTNLLLAGVLLLSSLSFADIQGTPGNFTLDDDAQILRCGIRFHVKRPLAAWWKDNGVFGSKTLIHNMGILVAGNNFPRVPIKEIYAIAPFSTQNNLRARITTGDMQLQHTSGAPTVIFPVNLKDKNGTATGKTILMDPDNAGADANAVTTFVAQTGLAGLGPFLGGEIIQVITNTSGKIVPNKPGLYNGVTRIRVELVP